MMALHDDDFAARLDMAPNSSEVVNQLFETAKAESESRVYLAVIDFEIITHDGKKYLTCEMTRHWMVQQFAEYFSRVISSIQEFEDAEDANVARRLQMLAYSQFWECLGIQRWLRQLVGIVNGEQYQARLFLDSRPSTYNIFKEIREMCNSVGLMLGTFLEATYSNQIRNAFSHSEVWMVSDYVTLENFDPTNENHVPSLKFETWGNLFTMTSGFIIALFKARRGLETELEAKVPYRIDLPEFAGPFNLSKDERGHWSARPTE